MDTFIITYNVSDGYTFGCDAYQIFEGTQDEAMARAVDMEIELGEYGGDFHVYKLGEQVV